MLVQHPEILAKEMITSAKYSIQQLSTVDDQPAREIGEGRSSNETGNEIQKRFLHQRVELSES